MQNLKMLCLPKNEPVMIDGTHKATDIEYLARGKNWIFVSDNEQSKPIFFRISLAMANIVNGKTERKKIVILDIIADKNTENLHKISTKLGNYISVAQNLEVFARMLPEPEKSKMRKTLYGNA